MNIFHGKDETRTLWALSDNDISVGSTILRGTSLWWMTPANRESGHEWNKEVKFT